MDASHNRRQVPRARTVKRNLTLHLSLEQHSLLEDAARHAGSSKRGVLMHELKAFFADLERRHRPGPPAGS